MHSRCLRGMLFEKLPRGAMLSIALPEDRCGASEASFRLRQ
jgi:hypothetical protein